MAVESTSLAPASSPFSAADPGPDTCVAGHREPAPFNDPELVHPGDPRAEIEKLGDRIAELSARIQAATYELLVLIRQFDERGGWSGFTSCAHWLSWRAGLAPGAAREHVRVARALADLPKLSDAMRRGVVSYSKMRAVTRVATPETEQTLRDVALAGTAAHVEQVVRAWRRVDRTAEAVDDRRRHASRTLDTWVDDDGMVVIRGRLTAEVGAVVRRALEAAVDEERRAATGAEGEPDAVDEAEGVVRSFGQRRADALGVVAERALAGGLDRGTSGDRYQVVVHVDAGALAEDAEDADVPAGTPRSSVHRRAASTSRPRPSGGSPVTPPPSRCGTVRTGRCSMSAAGPAPSLPPCAGRWPSATGTAGSPAVTPVTAMPIMSGTGRTVG